MIMHQNDSLIKIIYPDLAKKAPIVDLKHLFVLV
jgi:hypothetical protein